MMMMAMMALVAMWGLASGLELAVFPLRKMPRVPTETVRLRLFEARYLALARAVLAKEPSVFAAIYCGDAPAVLPFGQAPATPLLKDGSIGVVCRVTEATEDKTKDGRDRMTLTATALSRCRVISIIQSPIFEGDTPYLVIESEPVVDDAANDDVLALAEARASAAVIDRSWVMPHESELGLPSRQELESFGLLSTLDLTPRARLAALSQTDTAGRYDQVASNLEKKAKWRLFDTIFR